MAEIKKVFTVIDPTTDQQTALERAIRMAERNDALGLHLYCAVFNSATSGDLEALKRVEITRLDRGHGGGHQGPGHRCRY